MSENIKTIVMYQCDKCGKEHKYKDLLVEYVNHVERFTWHFCDHTEAVEFLATRQGYVKIPLSDVSLSGTTSSKGWST